MVETIKVESVVRAGTKAEHVAFRFEPESPTKSAISARLLRKIRSPAPRSRLPIYGRSIEGASDLLRRLSGQSGLNWVI